MKTIASDSTFDQVLEALEGRDAPGLWAAYELAKRTDCSWFSSALYDAWKKASARGGEEIAEIKEAVAVDRRKFFKPVPVFLAREEAPEGVTFDETGEACALPYPGPGPESREGEGEE